MSRAYFFNNMYLSSIQQGIQAAHAVTEMAMKYYPDLNGETDEADEMFYDWATTHKTMILLNGGYAENLHDLYNFIQTGNANAPIETIDNGACPFPYAKFHESDAAMDGMLTSVGIVLPAKIYEGVQAMHKIKRLRRDDTARLMWDTQCILTVDLGNDSPQDIEYTKFEVALMERLGTFRLAS